MNDRPSATELLAAVERFLAGEVMPALTGAARFHARVAANVVAIVAREIETEEADLGAEWERLGSLLDRDEARPEHRAALRAGVLARNQELARRIRAGDADAGPWRAAVLEHLEHTVDDKLRVARPRPREESV